MRKRYAAASVALASVLLGSLTTFSAPDAVAAKRRRPIIVTRCTAPTFATSIVVSFHNPNDTAITQHEVYRNAAGVVTTETDRTLDPHETESPAGAVTVETRTRAKTIVSGYWGTAGAPMRCVP